MGCEDDSSPPSLEGGRVGCAIKGALDAIAQGEGTMSQDKKWRVSVGVDAIQASGLKTRVAWCCCERVLKKRAKQKRSVA